MIAPHLHTPTHIHISHTSGSSPPSFFQSANFSVLFIAAPQMLVKGCSSQLLHSSSCIPHSTTPLGHYSLFPLISSSFLFTPGLFLTHWPSVLPFHSLDVLTPSLSLLLWLCTSSSSLLPATPHASVICIPLPNHVWIFYHDDDDGDCAANGLVGLMEFHKQKTLQPDTRVPFAWNTRKVILPHAMQGLSLEITTVLFYCSIQLDEWRLECQKRKKSYLSHMLVEQF